MANPKNLQTGFLMEEYENYLSPFSWRYGSPEMRALWSEAHKRRIWRSLWIALAEVQLEYDLTNKAQVADLTNHENEIDVPRALEIEAEIHHDLMAEIKTFAEQCPIGGGIIHLGATSVDIKDNTTALQIRESLRLVIDALGDLLLTFAHKISLYADYPVIAFTHLQPAEPTTLGYRLAQYAQDLLLDWQNAIRACDDIKGKGFKGAVGTSASYAELLGLENLEDFEAALSVKLGIRFYPVTTQTYPRKQEYHLLNLLAGLGASIYKFAFDLRFLQTPPIGEWAEPFGVSQVGSSAMPFKRNPIKSEKIDSLARLLAQYPRTAWDNAAHSLLERTLDDSANRRTLLPEAFLITDELLRVATKVVRGLVLDKTAMSRNLGTYGPFAATERVLMALSAAGGNRQKMHERLRKHSLAAWEAIREGESNPLVSEIASDSTFCKILPEDQILKLMDASAYIGDSVHRARALAAEILNQIRSR